MRTKTLNAGLMLAAAMLAGCAAGAANMKPAAVVATANGSSCPHSTGTRIPLGESDCAGPGRSYSSDQLQRTGATDAASALALLDPSITVRH